MLLWRNISSNSDCSLFIEYEINRYGRFREPFISAVSSDFYSKSACEVDRPRRDRDDRLGWCTIVVVNFGCRFLPFRNFVLANPFMSVPSVPVPRSCVASVGLFVSPDGNLTAPEYPKPDILVPDIVIRSNSLSVCFTWGTSSNRSPVCFVSWKLNILTRAINRFGRTIVTRCSKYSRVFLCE